MVFYQEKYRFGCGLGSFGFIRQRGIGNINPVKFGRCINELERIYGIRHGGDRVSESKATNGPLGPANQTELAEDLGVDKKTLQRAKKLAELPDDIQQMVMDGKAWYVSV